MVKSTGLAVIAFAELHLVWLGVAHGGCEDDQRAPDGRPPLGFMVAFREQRTQALARNGSGSLLMTQLGSGVSIAAGQARQLITAPRSSRALNKFRFLVRIRDPGAP